MSDIESFLPVMLHPFQGNKSFIAPNLGDAIAYSKTWNVCLVTLATRPSFNAIAIRFAPKLVVFSSRGSVSRISAGVYGTCKT